MPWADSVAGLAAGNAEGDDMSDTNSRPVKGGDLRGDDKSLPNRGSGTGVTDSYGADLSPGAKNRMGSITGATKSSPVDQCVNKEDRI